MTDTVSSRKLPPGRYEDDGTETSQIIRIVCQSIADYLNPLPPEKQKAIVQKMVDAYGSLEVLSAGERATVAKLNRTRKRKRKFY